MTAVVLMSGRNGGKGAANGPLLCGIGAILAPPLVEVWWRSLDAGEQNRRRPRPSTISGNPNCHLMREFVSKSPSSPSVARCLKTKAVAFNGTLKAAIISGPQVELILAPAASSSIGTNDLTQYTVASDWTLTRRNAPQ